MSHDIGTRIARLEGMVRTAIRSPKLAHASIEDGTVEVYDAQGSLRALVGQQPDGTSGVTIVNGPTPPTPSAPQVEPALAALTVTWNGTFTDAQVAPLDFARIEIHIGPSEDFTPDQSTLRDTIETSQGGSSSVPLPYTQWWVRLRARSLAGVTGKASTPVAETPRRAAAADIQAGAITAESLAADAITGKTIVGGSIDGAIVTGSTVRTGATGSRVVVTPNPPQPMEQIPSLLLCSGSPTELAAGALRANVKVEADAYPVTELAAPAVQIDNWNMPDTAQLTLVSPQMNVRGGSFSLEANTGLNKEQGQAQVYAFTARDRTDTSLLRLYCEDGPRAPGSSSTGPPARSWIEMTGATVTVRTASASGDTKTVLDARGITTDGYVRRSASDWRTFTVINATGAGGSAAPSVRIAPDNALELSGIANLSNATISNGMQIGLLPEGFRPPTWRSVLVPSSSGSETVLRLDINPDGVLKLYAMVGKTASWVSFDGVTCRMV